MPQFTFHARLVHRSIVTVEADNIEDARKLANAGQFVDDGMAGAELVDWDINSSGRQEQ